jgi:hypothetical protein
MTVAGKVITVNQDSVAAPTRPTGVTVKKDR